MMIMAAIFVVLVFVSAALQPTDDDKEDSCCENKGENDESFHSCSVETVEARRRSVETLA